MELMAASATDLATHAVGRESGAGSTRVVAEEAVEIIVDPQPITRMNRQQVSESLAMK